MLSSGSPVRALILSCLFVLAACPSSLDRAATASEDDGNDGAGNGAIPQSCFQDTDCATAAATCCECPAFAVSTSDPAHRACTGVTCPGQNQCPDNVRAACDQGQCVLACVEMVCPTSCAAGYTIDPTGCLSCECAAPELNGCEMDADCVQTRADCCGCDQGGEDTAVLASEQPSYDAALGCMASPACPAINVCQPGAAPRCIQGRCELSTSDGLPPNACGRADLPPCPSGQACTVNTSDQANMQGVGVCAPT